MVINLTKIFKTKRKGKSSYIPSIEVITAILGNCWRSECSNVDIVNYMKKKNLKGHSSGNISEALSYLDNSVEGAGIIISKRGWGRKRTNTIDFHAILDYIFSYLVSFSQDEETKKQKKYLLDLVKRKRKRTGEMFLSMFSNKGVLEYFNWKKIFMICPEIMLYLILVSDLSSMMNSYQKDSRENDELTQERIFEIQQEWLNKYLQGKKEYNNEIEAPKDESFYSALMRSFEAKIVTNYEKRHKDIRIAFSAIKGVRENIIIF
ncbi:MAG: hypothetical protein ACFFB5_12735 [Promethearchaeota archaeon]